MIKNSFDNFIDLLEELGCKIIYCSPFKVIIATFR